MISQYAFISESVHFFDQRENIIFHALVLLAGRNCTYVFLFICIGYAVAHICGMITCGILKNLKNCL